MRQMQCDQCGRMLAPRAATTIVCPSCGYAAIVPAEAIASTHAALDDSATRPVPAETLPSPLASPQASPATPAVPEQDRPTSPPPPVSADTQAASPLGAYVPPSLPRSRADTPAEPIPAGSDQPNEDAHALPSALLRGRDPLNDTRPVDGPAVRATVAGDGRRAPLTVASAVVLLVVLVLGTVAAVLAANGRLNALFAPLLPAAAPTALPTVTAGPPAPPAGFTRFTASDGTYTLAVPAGWTQVTEGRWTLFANTSEGANFEIESLAGQLDLQTVTQDFLARLDPTPPGATGTPQLGPLTSDSAEVAGIVWDRTAADMTVTSSGVAAPWQVLVLATQHNGATLLIAYFAPRGLFAGENTAHFQVMLDNLMLLSPRP